MNEKMMFNTSEIFSKETSKEILFQMENKLEEGISLLNEENNKLMRQIVDNIKYFLKEYIDVKRFGYAYIMSATVIKTMNVQDNKVPIYDLLYSLSEHVFVEKFLNFFQIKKNRADDVIYSEFLSLLVNESSVVAEFLVSLVEQKRADKHAINKYAEKEIKKISGLFQHFVEAKKEDLKKIKTFRNKYLAHFTLGVSDNEFGQIMSDDVICSLIAGIQNLTDTFETLIMLLYSSLTNFDRKKLNRLKAELIWESSYFFDELYSLTSGISKEEIEMEEKLRKTLTNLGYRFDIVNFMGYQFVTTDVDLFMENLEFVRISEPKVIFSNI